jgi:hypothetical protein
VLLNRDVTDPRGTGKPTDKSRLNRVQEWVATHNSF